MRKKAGVRGDGKNKLKCNGDYILAENRTSSTFQSLSTTPHRPTRNVVECQEVESMFDVFIRGDRCRV